jgi:hypothetical protein
MKLILYLMCKSDTQNKAEIARTFKKDCSIKHQLNLLRHYTTSFCSDMAKKHTKCFFPPASLGSMGGGGQITSEGGRAPAS